MKKIKWKHLQFRVYERLVAPCKKKLIWNHKKDPDVRNSLFVIRTKAIIIKRLLYLLEFFRHTVCSRSNMQMGKKKNKTENTIFFCLFFFLIVEFIYKF